MTISFPYSGSLTPVVFVAWIPLLLVESYISSKNYKSGKVFIHAYLTFFIYNIGTTWWVYNASSAGSIMAFIANSLLMALTFYAFHLTKKYVGTKEGYISLLIYWISFEYLHYNWDASWTWMTLGNTFSIQPAWIQWYSYTGVLGGTLWVLIVNLLLFRAYQNYLFKGEKWSVQTPFFILASVALVVPLTISIITYYTYVEEKNPVEIVVVQPNIDPYNEKFNFASLHDQLDKIGMLAAEKSTENTDLILAPETAIGQSFFEGDIKRLNIYQHLLSIKRQAHNAPMCIGASTQKIFEKKNSRASFALSGGPGFIEYYNTSMFIDEKNEPSFIHKSKLVPGVEMIPFSDYLPILEEWSIDLDGTTGTLGTEDGPKVFKTEKFTYAPVVCYESIYGEWVTEQCRQGAELICIATNDGWWKDTPGYKQHMSFAQLRAIENRRSIARSANTGTSGFINQRGDVIQATDWWVPDALRATLNLNRQRTFYMTYGNVLGRSFSFVTVLLLLFTFVKRFKKLVIK